MSSFVTGSARADVKRLLDYAAELISRLERLDPLRAEPTLDTFKAAVARLREESSRYDEPYRLAVVGDFKVGKSSLVNALLGQRGLVAEGVVPTTGAVTELQYCGEPCGVVLSGSGEKVFDGTLEDAAQYADQRTPEGRSVSGKGVRVILKQPARVLERLTIVDTPGLGANPLDDRTTLESLHLADAAILVMAASRAGGESPVALAQRLRSANKRLTLVLTRADLDPAKARTGADEMARVFEHVIDGPPVIFSSKLVQEALSMAAASAESGDQELAARARSELAAWGHTELTSRILRDHLSSEGASGRLRAIGALGELKKCCKALSLSAARERDACAALVESLTQSLDDTERLVSEKLDSKVPYLEDRIEDIVDQYIGRLLDTLREAVELFVDETMDAGLTEGLSALWAMVDSEYETRRRRELQRRFDRLFPTKLPQIASRDIERAVSRLLLAEWKATVREVGGTGVDASIGVETLMKKLDEHFLKVLASVAAQITSFLALLFVPGGALLNIAELVGSSLLAEGQMSKADARVALVKRRAGQEIRNQRMTIRDPLAEHYRRLNREVHERVVKEARASSKEQLVQRDAASANLHGWKDAVRDMASVLESVADIEQGGI